MIRRKNEESLWTAHALNQGLTRVVNAGRVEGLTDLSQGVGLDLKPYGVGRVSSAPATGQTSAIASGDIGLDAFYNVTPAMKLNVSINTDFAETEVDERRVNLTRFPLFFEEKRDFFLEGSSYFDFARDAGPGGHALLLATHRSRYARTGAAHRRGWQAHRPRRRFRRRRAPGAHGRGADGRPDRRRLLGCPRPTPDVRAVIRGSALYPPRAA